MSLLKNRHHRRTSGLRRLGRHVKHALWPKNPWLRPLTLLAALLLLVGVPMWGIGTYYRQQQAHKPYQIGTSFSKTYAQELGLDWQAAYTSILYELQPSRVRLMSYWNEIEPTQGQYQFNDLDWQMNEAAKANVKVSLAIGERQPRWPECHTPPWAQNFDTKARQDAIVRFVQEVVTRYREHPALQNYQLENEYFNKQFGECKDRSRERLAAEYHAVKVLDDKHLVTLSFADQLGFPFGEPKPDEYATSLYVANYVKVLGYFRYPIPWFFYSAKNQLVQWLHGRETYIHELQLEPWGPRATREMSIEEQNTYMGPTKMKYSLDFGKQTGVKTIDLWGSEWWYWRKTHFNDPVPWDTIKNAITEFKASR